MTTTPRLAALLITGVLAVAACVGTVGAGSSSLPTPAFPATAPPSSQQVLAQQNAAHRP